MAAFVFLSTTDWDAPQFGSRQQIALRLARRGHRVLFVEVPRALHSLISDPQATRQALRRMGRVRPPDGFPDLAPQLRVYTPRPVLPIYYHPTTNAVNQALLGRDLRRTLDRLGWRPDVLWTYWANSARIVGRLGERIAVYHCIDSFAAVRYPLVTPGTIAAMEADLCRRVDLILARTAELAEDKRRHNPNTVYLPGGVDAAMFDPAQRHVEPAALAEAPHPRAGFLGTLDDRVDVDLVASAARQLPGVNFVLVGPHKRHLVDLAALQALPNVQMLPACPPAAVPSYVAGFDVCLIPYRVNPYTQGLSPLKLYEYLAMGKEVVATELPYLTREAGTICIAQTPAEFTAGIAAALSAPASQEVARLRRAAAMANSWDAQVSTIEEHLARLLGDRP
jgi:glycosyltransferase involved in cell wall biosynthesis